MDENRLLERLSASPLSRTQIIAISIVIALCALDGFDVFAITFVIPQLEQEWQVGKAQLGFVVSIGLLGMALGSLLISPLADIWGRRRVLIPSLLLVTAGTAWSAISSGIVELGFSRLATGVGIGAMIAIINPLAAEYSNTRRRDLSVMLVNLGFPVGAIGGGTIAAWLLPAYGWRSLFICAAVLGSFMSLLAIRWLPEPVTSLLSSSGDDALKKVNAYLRSCNQAEVEHLPEMAGSKAKGLPMAVLIRGDRAVPTMQVMAIYFLYVISLFYIQSWIPSIVVGAGFDVSQAAYVSVWMNGGGIAGGLLFGIIAPRAGLKRTVISAFVAGSLSIATFHLASGSVMSLAVAGAVLGIFTIGGMIGLYAVVSRSFSAEVRASGTGLVIGFGRLGSTLGPVAGGILFSWGLGQSLISISMAVPTLIAAVLLLLLKLKEK